MAQDIIINDMDIGTFLAEHWDSLFVSGGLLYILWDRVLRKYLPTSDEKIGEKKGEVEVASSILDNGEQILAIYEKINEKIKSETAENRHEIAELRKELSEVRTESRRVREESEQIKKQLKEVTEELRKFGCWRGYRNKEIENPDCENRLSKDMISRLAENDEAEKKRAKKNEVFHDKGTVPK